MPIRTTSQLGQPNYQAQWDQFENPQQAETQSFQDAFGDFALDPIQEMQAAGVMDQGIPDADKIPMGGGAQDFFGNAILGQQVGPQLLPPAQLGGGVPGEMDPAGAARPMDWNPNWKLIMTPNGPAWFDGNGRFVRGAGGPGGGGAMIGGIMSPMSYGSQGGYMDSGLFGIGNNDPLGGMIGQIDKVFKEEADRAWITEQKRKDRLLKLEMLKELKDIYSGIGGDDGQKTVKEDRGYGFRNLNSASPQWAHTSGDFGTDIPRGLPEVDVRKLGLGVRANVPRSLPVRGAQRGLLGRILNQGKQAGVEVALNKLGQEQAQGQAAEAANQLSAESQQGVANAGWLQDMREAVSRVQERGADIAATGDNAQRDFFLKQFQNLLNPIA